MLTQADFEGQAYEVVKAFYPDVIHLQFQIEECHKMLTDQVDWMNPEGDQGSSPALSISKMKAASYPDFGLELLVPEQMWIDDVCTYDITYSRYEYDYLSEIVLQRADLQEHTIAEKDFKNLYPSDFEDLNLLLLQGYLDHLSGSDKRMISTAVKLFTIGQTLNPGMNTRFWTQKDVTRSKEFIASIERRLKMRRIYQNLECFVGGRVRDIDYRLLQRTE
ncbi:hypothetical protein Tco_0083655 [Tanacetum coccineum]